MSQKPSRPLFLANNRTPIWVLITGNLRSGKEFRQIFATILDQRDQGLIDGIVFTTWTGELDQAPGLQQSLHELGVTVLLVDQPQNSPKLHTFFHGFLYYQRKAIHFGLKAIPEGAFVIKARTDLIQERYEALSAALFQNPDLQLETELASPLLRTRLFTFDTRPDHLFYWDDIAFSGFREDLLKINNCQITNEVLYPHHNLPPECRLFAPTFLAAYPLLEWFFENISGKDFAALLHAWAVASEKPKLPILVIEILASYFHILSRYLLLPAGDETEGELRLEDFFRETAGSRAIKPFGSPWKSHKIHHQGILDQLLKSRNIAGEELSLISKLMSGMDTEQGRRGVMPFNMEQRIGELKALESELKIIVFHPQHSLQPVSQDHRTNTDELMAIPLPEKRHLSWLEGKKLGLKRAAASLALKKLLG